MKLPRTLLVLACALIILAGAGYLGATALIESVYAYRSPLHNQPPQTGEVVGPPLTHRVIMVLIDALRADTATDVQVMPVLNRLRSQGASATMHSRPPSYSEPGYSTLFTGAWPEINDGPAYNLSYEDIPTWTQDNLYLAAHQAGLKTAVSGYYWFEKLIPQDAVSTGFYTPGDDAAADVAVMNAALPWVKDPSYNFILIHLDQVDYAGEKEGGPRGPHWNEAAHRTDDDLAAILASLDLTQDTLLICSDHGQIDAGGHGGQDLVTLKEPFVLVGEGVIPGNYGDIQMVDVAPTLAVLLGTRLPASTQGTALLDMLKITQPAREKVVAIQQQQQLRLLAAYQSAIGRPQQAPLGDVSVKTVQVALEAARQARVNVERWPRLILAILLALIPAGWMILRRSKTVLPMLVGAGLYTLLFHFRYAILDGKTYSISSVPGPTQLILYNAITVAISLTAAWLLVALWQKWFRLGPAKVGERTMFLALTAIYLTALPVLWNFGFYGFTVTWFLPNFASNFLALLSQIQILFIALVGLLLAGAAALVSRVTVSKRA